GTDARGDPPAMQPLAVLGGDGEVREGEPDVRGIAIELALREVDERVQEPRRHAGASVPRPGRPLRSQASLGYNWWVGKTAVTPIHSRRAFLSTAARAGLAWPLAAAGARLVAG